MPTVGVFASIFDSARRILLVRHSYGSGQWSTPGGRVEPGESPTAALEREIREEIACEIQVAHLIGIYAKPYRDDLVLSFAVTIASGSPQPLPPEISEIAFFSGDLLPDNIAFNSRVRVEDAFDRCRGIVRVFDSATSLVASFDSDVCSHGMA